MLKNNNLVKSKRSTPALTSNRYNNLLKSKRSQITIFVIIAVLLIAAILLLYLLYQNSIKPGLQKLQQDPNQVIEECVRVKVEEAANKLIENGGYLEVKSPIKFKEFEYKKVPYLCYTSQNDKHCIIQEPVLIEHLEDEIYSYIQDNIENCFNNLKKDLEDKDYKVTLGPSSFVVELLPRKARIHIWKNFEATNSDKSFSYTEFESVTSTPLYDLGIVAQEITRQESKWCNSDYPLLMKMNKWVQITKFQTGDDNKIYDVKDTKTEKNWRFAIRGCVLDTPT